VFRELLDGVIGEELLGINLVPVLLQFKMVLTFWDGDENSRLGGEDQ